MELLWRHEKVTLWPRRDILLLVITSLTKQRRLSAKSYFSLNKIFFTLYLGETFLPRGNKRFHRLHKIRIRNLWKMVWGGGVAETVFKEKETKCMDPICRSGLCPHLILAPEWTLTHICHG
jgi:hypothetical protein